jgi:mannose-1-phosphate guanylyltransferase
MFNGNSDKNNEEIFSTGKQHLWGIVLAGGEGNRLKDLVKKQYGYHRPKQFCTFIGTRSLIRHTLDRALKLIPREHLFTVITKHQYKYAVDEIGYPLLNMTVTQPCARETSAGILLPMLKINHIDPEAIVTIFPSDHFINEENYFMDYVLEANLFVVNNPGSIVMLGVKPDRIESGYGWIEPGIRVLYHGEKIVRGVKRFWEKPSPEKAETLWHKGSLWNTFVLIGRSTTFIKNIKVCVPAVFNAFEPIRKEIGTSREKITIEKSFKFIPALNFSRFVLEMIPEQLRVMEVSDVYWSDWGDEKRIRNDLEKLSLTMVDSVVPEID